MPNPSFCKVKMIMMHYIQILGSPKYVYLIGAKLLKIYKRRKPSMKGLEILNMDLIGVQDISFINRGGVRGQNMMCQKSHKSWSADHIGNNMCLENLLKTALSFVFRI